MDKTKGKGMRSDRGGASAYPLLILGENSMENKFASGPRADEGP